MSAHSKEAHEETGSLVDVARPSLLQQLAVTAVGIMLEWLESVLKLFVAISGVTSSLRRNAVCLPRLCSLYRSGGRNQTGELLLSRVP